jgi:hypothetical protein
MFSGVMIGRAAARSSRSSTERIAWYGNTELDIFTACTRTGRICSGVIDLGQE